METSHHYQSLEVEGAESQCQRLSSLGQHPCQQLLGGDLMKGVCVCLCVSVCVCACKLKLLKPV